MSFRLQNIEVIESLGFKNMNFSGYGGTGFEKGDLRIWLSDMGIASIEKVKNRVLVREYKLGNYTEELLKDIIVEYIDNLNIALQLFSKTVCSYCNGSGELAGGLVGCHHCGNY